jgi:hypothetical protein
VLVVHDPHGLNDMTLFIILKYVGTLLECPQFCCHGVHVIILPEFLIMVPLSYIMFAFFGHYTKQKLLLDQSSFSSSNTM